MSHSSLSLGCLNFTIEKEGGVPFLEKKISDAESDSDFPCSNFCKHQNRMNPLLTLGFASGAPTVDLYFLQFCSIIQVQVRLVCPMLLQ